MEFDPVGSAESIPHMIKNDTLIEVLDEDQLSECLKHIILNVDDSLYILDRVQSKYKVPDRFKAVHHILTDFGKGDNFDSLKFVEFIRALGRCLHFNILYSIATIIESTFPRNDQHLPEINHTQRLISAPQTQNPAVNKNIEELKQTPKITEQFNQIFNICERIAEENDKDAMNFAVKEKFVYVTEKVWPKRSIFTFAAAKNKIDMIRIMIESGVDVNTRDNNSTALIYASMYGCHEIVKLLLAVPGIDVNAIDYTKDTALYWASRNGRLKVVKLLLAVPGIDINAKDISSQTALKIASEKGHQEIVKLLLAVPGIDRQGL